MQKPIEIKIATVVAVAVILHSAEIDVLSAALKKMTAGTPDFFEDEFAIIDVESIADKNIDWIALLPLLQSVGFRPVAVRNADEAQHDAIRAQGLSIDVVNKPRPDLSAAEKQIENQATPIEVVAEAPVSKTPQFIPHTPAMVIDTPIRAGQRIYARGCDLIITASVNNGAEVIADGSIHIYAPLRGRALAGATGNTEARIYTLGLEAELVSIAGIYRTFENGFPTLAANRPVQIKLIGDSIEVSSVKSHV